MYKVEMGKCLFALEEHTNYSHIEISEADKENIKIGICTANDNRCELNFPKEQIPALIKFLQEQYEKK